MKRALQIATVILAISAIACVLITPDLTDDVYGVVHNCHLDLAISLSAFCIDLATTTKSMLAILALSVPHGCDDISAVTCVRLC